MEKYNSRRIRGEIRRVLLNIWDPIGIVAEPNAQDEYDLYLGGVFELLVEGATDQQIASHLLDIVHGRMALTSAKLADMQETVAALRQIRLS